VRATRPSEDDLAALLQSHRRDKPTVEPGLTLDANSTPAGYRRDRWVADVGTGEHVFTTARAVVHTWGVHRGAGLRIAVTGDVAPGARIAFTSPLPITGHVVGTCEVVDVTDEPGWFGFAYATLPLHPEQGEERFDVVLADDGQVRFEITAVWRPNSLLARLAPSAITERLQRDATHRYFEALGKRLRS
jgi:uncharacterized protein (UPF0548 family)